MQHTHVHTNGAEGVLWVDHDGQLQGSTDYAHHLIDIFGASGKTGQDLLDFIKQELDPGLMAGTTDCAEEGHVPSFSPYEDETPSENVEPRITDNWQDYQGEGEREHRDISFGNDTMYLP